jgi:hypothetical protein
VHLERNLNPTLSAVYVCTGVLMMLAGLVTYALLPNWAVLVLVICGSLSIAGGALHHWTMCQVFGINTNSKK